MLGNVFRVECAFPNMEGRAFLNENCNKIGGKSEENRDDGQYCWVVISGSRVSVQRGKFGCF
jgi:hypothetical protein